MKLILPPPKPLIGNSQFAIPISPSFLGTYSLFPKTKLQGKPKVNHGHQIRIEPPKPLIRNSQPTKGAPRSSAAKAGELTEGNLQLAIPISPSYFGAYTLVQQTKLQGKPKANHSHQIRIEPPKPLIRNLQFAIGNSHKSFLLWNLLSDRKEGCTQPN